MTGIGLKEKLLYIIDRRASCCVYATNNGSSMIWFLFFKVAPVLEVIRFTCHVHRARDLRETRMYIINTALEKQNQLI